MTTSLKQADLRRAQIKNTTDSQKTKRREQKHKTKGNHQTTKKKEQRRHRINWKARFEMAINTYLSIITLNINGLDAPVERQSERLDEKNKSLQYATHKRPTLGQRGTQR